MGPGNQRIRDLKCWLVPCWRFDAGCRLIDGAWDSKHERLLTFIKESSPQMFHFWDSEKRRFLCNTRKERFEEQPSCSILSIIYGLWSVWVYCLLWLFISRHLRRKNEMFSVLSNVLRDAAQPRTDAWGLLEFLQENLIGKIREAVTITITIIQNLIIFETSTQPSKLFLQNWMSFIVTFYLITSSYVNNNLHSNFSVKLIVPKRKIAN